MFTEMKYTQMLFEAPHLNIYHNFSQWNDNRMPPFFTKAIFYAGFVGIIVKIVF